MKVPDNIRAIIPRLPLVEALCATSSISASAALGFFCDVYLGFLIHGVQQQQKGSDTSFDWMYRSISFWWMYA
uniref:Uncharacterized protein n=1 Tax=Solanum lycopersicum TaxID=4081 RepID=A0A3Q7F269_SOLLC